MKKGSRVYGDAAYMDESLEALLHLRKQELISDQRMNSRRTRLLSDWLDLQGFRKTVETAFSRVTALRPRKIHAVTESGFAIKSFGFVVAVSIFHAIN